VPGLATAVIPLESHETTVVLTDVHAATAVSNPPEASVPTVASAATDALDSNAGRKPTENATGITPNPICPSHTTWPGPEALRVACRHGATNSGAGHPPGWSDEHDDLGGDADRQFAVSTIRTILVRAEPATVSRLSGEREPAEASG
jgi:hypothetical protein